MADDVVVGCTRWRWHQCESCEGCDGDANVNSEHGRTRRIRFARIALLVCWDWLVMSQTGGPPVKGVMEVPR